MHEFAEVFRNTFLLWLARLSQPVTSVILTVAIAQRLLDKGLGSYTTAITYYFTFQLVSSIGLKNLLTREISKAPDTLWGQVVSALALVIPSALLTTAAATLLLPIFADDAETRLATLVLLPAILASAIIDVIEGLLFGISRFRYYSISHTAENVLRVLLAWILLLEGHGVVALCLVFAGARVAQLLSCSIYFLVVCGPPRIGERGPRVRELWHQSLPFVAIMVVVTLYGRLDVLVLYPVWGEDEV
ncbi:MAG: oligosaccharide flippase family protein, partial [Planctomycetota bacterium]